MKKNNFFKAMLLPFSKTFLLFAGLSFFFNFSQAQTFTAITKAINSSIGGYWEYLPVDYATSGKKYPLLVSMHGVGKTGDGSQTELQKVRQEGLAKRIYDGNFPDTFNVEDSTFSFIVVCPQFKDNVRNDQNIKRFLDTCIKNYRVDVKKIYMTGLSQGGGTTEFFMSRGNFAGNYLAAVAPVCGNYPTSPTAASVVALANLPTSFFHNSNDPDIKVSGSRDWYNNLIAAESSPAPLLTIFTPATATHDAWTKTYDPATKVNGLNVYEWMLQYKRVSPTKVASFLDNPVAKIYGGRLITLPTDSITLKGDSSTGNITGYQWKYVSGPSGYTLTSTAAVNLKITNLAAGSYTFRLIATSNGTFKDSIQYNFFVNAKPVANAGTDKTITLPTDSVTLIGTATDANGNSTVTTYAWSKVSGASATITPTNNDTTKITGLQQGVYFFKLTVTDNKGATDTDTVKVTVNVTNNVPPTAYAGLDTTITLPKDSITLVGSGTDSDGTISSYKWSKISGSTANIVSPDLASTKITNLLAGSYTFRLTVTDNDSATATNDVIVSVNQPPTAIIIAPDTITLPMDTVVFDGRNSSDADGTITYKWTKTAGPVFTSYGSTQPVFRALDIEAGIYTFKLVVTDNKDGKDSVYHTLVVNPAERVINVNIHSGTNPYNNAEWNGWKVDSSLNTAALKYSDGTVSSINAVLSNGSQVSDNGATYSKSMAPAPVIRYTSHSTIARTLTLSGLSPSKLYDIEIYASRSYHTGESTIFSTGAESDTIATYHNNTKVIFNNISPDAQQRIIININRLLTHNFINGFKITEKAGGSLRVVTQTPANQAVTTTEKTFTNKKALSVSPNPANDKILLQLNNPYKGTLKVQLVDINGRVQRELGFKKDQQLFQRDIYINQLSAGSYILQLNIGKWKVSKIILKQ